jgi:RNA recognition motif-containing protein
VNIFIANFPPSWEETDLHNAFAEHGAVRSVKIILDRETKKSRCFGFVDMASEDDGLRAIAALNDAHVGSRKLTVNQARPRSEREAYVGAGRR